MWTRISNEFPDKTNTGLKNERERQELPAAETIAEVKEEEEEAYSPPGFSVKFTSL